MTNRTLLVDFDGVLRHWFSSSIESAEIEYEIAAGTTLNAVFSRSLLHPVVTGKITHLDWERMVGDKLSETCGDNVSRHLLSAWREETWEIDEFLLEELSRVAPDRQLVLVTNATDKLQKDLVKSGLENRFDVVVNSSEIGVAKPDVNFYRHVLALSNSTAKDCIYIDDTAAHIKAAQKLGITSVLHESAEITLKMVRRACT